MVRIAFDFVLNPNNKIKLYTAVDLKSPFSFEKFFKLKFLCSDLLLYVCRHRCKAFNTCCCCYVYIGAPPCGQARALPTVCVHERLQKPSLSPLVAQAVNTAGVGPFSEAVLCQTPCSVPAAVSHIYVLKESELQRFETSADEDEEEEVDSRPQPCFSPSTCLGISWDPPCDHGSEITCYLIDLGERQPIVAGPVTKYIIQHLQPDTTYRSALRCKCFRFQDEMIF